MQGEHASTLHPVSWTPENRLTLLADHGLFLIPSQGEGTIGQIKHTGQDDQYPADDASLTREQSKHMDKIKTDLDECRAYDLVLKDVTE